MPVRESGKSAAPKEKLPAFVQPELATRVDRAPDGDSWIHEIKLDGYRLLARKDGKKVKLLSRNNLDWTTRAAAITADLEKLSAESCMLDGELVVFDADGKTHFQSLQNFQRNVGGPEPVYIAFDILHLNGKNLRPLPLIERKAMLEKLLKRKRLKRVHYSPYTAGNGPAAFESARRDGLEGIISKKADSAYISGRTRSWLKLKCDNQQEFVICGMTPSTEGPRKIGSLLLSLGDGKGGFRYAGRVGTGFSDALRRELFEKLSRIKTARPGIENAPRMREAIWIRPKIVAQIHFRELTQAGHVRQAVFQGLREDLKALQVKPEPIVDLEVAKKAAAKEKKAAPRRKR